MEASGSRAGGGVGVSRLKGTARKTLSSLEQGKRQYARGDLRGAVQSYRAALIDDPSNPEVIYRCGVALVGMRDYRGAAAFLTEAVKHDPKSAAAQYNLGVALEASGQDGSAERAYLTALDLAPDNVIPLVNLGGIAYRKGLPDIGYGYHERALASETTDPDQLGQRSFARLVRGDYTTGFQEYECRWQSAQVKGTNWQPVVSQRWHGEPFETPTHVLVYAEQGLGDTIQMLRYHDQLRLRNVEPVYAVDPAVWPLLPPNAQVCAPKTEPVGVEYSIPMLSLPLAFGTTVDTIPLIDGYLIPPSQLDLSALERTSRPLVGVCTFGNKDHMNDKDRSLPPSLRAFYEHADAWGIDWVCLDRAECFFELRNLGDTADVIDRLDAVVTIDSAVFHLAAALGKRTYLMPPSSPEWRHGLPSPGGNSGVPWYGDHVTAFWRRHTRDWPETIRRVCHTVRKELA